MEKKYQVFLSSTYLDLVDERSRVTHALLEMDCIPSGMELFPAGNDGQWPTIQRIIKSCDYFVLILAGRYGSLHSSGKSYIELEYRFAEECGVPIAAFLKRDIGSIPRDCSETDPGAQQKLAEFRNYVQEGRLFKYWGNADDIGGSVSTSLYQLIKATPREGWIRRSHALIEPSHLRTRLDRIESILVIAMRSIVLMSRKTRAQTRCLVTLLDPTGNTRRTICGINTRLDPEHRMGVPAAFGVAGRAFLEGKYVAADLPANHVDGYPADVRPLVWDQLKCVAAAPLKAEDGKIIGTLNFDATRILRQTALGHPDFCRIVEAAALAIEPYVAEIYAGQERLVVP